jgi:hypothetical protein
MKDQNMSYFAETSAKSGANVEKLFTDIAKFIYHKHKDSLHRMVEDETASHNSVHTRSSDLSYMNRLQSSGIRHTQLNKKLTYVDEATQK